MVRNDLHNSNSERKVVAMATTKRERRSFLEVQVDAANYSRDYCSKTPLNIPTGLTQEQFGSLMQAFIRCAAESWAAGYEARSEEKAR
jgi:hypothetical protein